MTDLTRVRRKGLIVLLLVSLLVVGASWLDAPTIRNADNQPVVDYPELFVEASACPDRDDVLETGRRLEERARLRADRYAYDPRDGVLAVQRYQEAEACYRAAGAQREISRVRGPSIALAARVNVDYAAARLNLVNALEQERWSAALSEIHRLLLLTDHLERHEYVEWLKKIIGRVGARASTAS